MILYSAAQLYEAWQYDCKIRKTNDEPSLEIAEYENKFIYNLESIMNGHQNIVLDIHIPDYMLESMHHSIDMDYGERIH
jgi:hypothetical protein